MQTQSSCMPRHGNGDEVGMVGADSFDLIVWDSVGGFEQKVAIFSKAGFMKIGTSIWGMWT